jgi:hypothetical protein
MGGPDLVDLLCGKRTRMLACLLAGELDRLGAGCALYA